MEFKQANVIISDYKDKKIKEAENSMGFVPASDLNKLNRYAQARYSTIIRTPLTSGPENIAASCGEMIYDGNGGWIGMGWFKKQQSYDACLKVCTLNKVSSQYCPCDNLFKNKEK